MGENKIIQLELFYLNVEHYGLIGDFYFKYCQLNDKNEIQYVGYHCYVSGHSLSDMTLERLVEKRCD